MAGENGAHGDISVNVVVALANPSAAWPERYLFTQYANCAVRNSRFRLVSVGNGKENWEPFDISKDPGEKNNVRAEHPKEFQELKAAYDRCATGTG